MSIFISEDGASPEVARVIEDARREFSLANPKSVFLHKHFPDFEKYYENGYFKLSSHFKWALDEVGFILIEITI